MKIIVCLLVLALMLSGCGTQVYETLGNVAHVGQTQQKAREILLEMPQDASVLTASGADILYICDGYTLSLQNMPSGNLAATIRGLSGYDPAQLTVVETLCGDHKRYDWVWAAAGEQGDVLCRGAVLDDGNYHYSLCVSANTDRSGELNEVWNALFDSFCLAPKEEA